MFDLKWFQYLFLVHGMNVVDVRLLRFRYSLPEFMIFPLAVPIFTGFGSHLPGRGGSGSASPEAGNVGVSSNSIGPPLLLPNNRASRKITIRDSE